MSEFGHISNRGGGVCLDAWGAEPFVIEGFRFEDSDQFGPVVVNQDGSIKAEQPGERSPFWAAYSAWRKQGRRMAGDGVTCLWTPLRPTKFKIVRGRAILIEAGDEGGDYVEAKP